MFFNVSFQNISKSTPRTSHSLKLIHFGFLFALLFVVFLFGARVANAATLYFSPSSGSFSVGDVLQTSIFVNTERATINNVDAVINFPASLLEIVSLNKTGSIFSLWVEEPAFANGAGTITFNGGLPTPGFNSTSGRILNVVFRAKSSGTASVLFSSGAVRANDGYGTDVLRTTSGAQFALTSAEQLPPVSGVPQAPVISSASHPNPNLWYAKDEASFSWSVPSDVTASRLLIGRLSNAVPTVLYTPAISEKTVGDLGDGVLYFSVQLRNNIGWGGIGRLRVQIDTTKPERFDIELARRDDPTGPRVPIIFDAEDATSGIDHYEIKIDGKDAIVWRDDGSGLYETPVLEPGTHALTAKAVDRAGNFLGGALAFDVQALELPAITEYPKQLKRGELLIIRGETYPDSDVTIFVQRKRDEHESFEVRSDSEGEFSFATEESPKGGVYEVWAEVTDSRGAKSGPSEKMVVNVEEQAFIQIGSFLIGMLSVFVVVVALLALIFFIPWVTYHKSARFRRGVTKEIREAESATHRAFDSLREDVRKQIDMLERARTKRELTREEERIVKRMKKHLDKAEKTIRKKIQKIEKSSKK